MLHFNYIPTPLRLARTILIHKGGDETDIKQWRPISIFSVVRRVIERSLNLKLKSYISLSSHQRGFVSMPGTHINTSLINGCLQSAKSTKSNCCILFLDISKAFDSIQHDHLKYKLRSASLPKNLCLLIESLLSDNVIQIEANFKKSKYIPVLRGVPQGSPLSPTLFNLAVDDIIQDLTDQHIAENFGHSLSEEMPNLTAFAFADDIAIVAKNEKAAASLVHLTESNLARIGLHVNPQKSKAIIIKNGKLTGGGILTTQNSKITSIQDKTETIKYLGVDFNEEIVLDCSKLITNLNSDLNNLVQSKLLRPDQKLVILNQYIWPTLIYPLQCAPLHRLSEKFLNNLNKLLRSTVKEILGLPGDIPNAMLYAPKKLRGLGLINAKWEANIQHFNICNKLSKINDIHLHHVRNVETEQNLTLQRLEISKTDLPINVKARHLRDIVRQRSFEEWRQLPHKGQGVSLFEECPKANSWIIHKKNLSSSEFTNAIKMSCNATAVRSVPGRSFNTTRCRLLGCNETETLPHVLGFCRKGELL